MGFVCLTSEKPHVFVDEVSGENTANRETLDNQETQDVKDVNHPSVGQCTMQSHPEQHLLNLQQKNTYYELKNKSELNYGKA